jgi:5'-3' exonuclease
MMLSSREEKCFRYDIAKTKPYKGKRAPKPKYYNELYEEVIKHYPHYIAVKGREVDDELGIMQTRSIRDGNYDQDGTVICTSDKDLLQIPGKQYNLDTRALFEVDRTGHLHLTDKGQIKGTGLKWFYAQMLLGDAVDNIPRIPAKVIPGESKRVAERIYEGLSGTLEECEAFVEGCFADQYGNEGKTKMLEIGRLLRILTVEDKDTLWELEYGETK